MDGFDQLPIPGVKPGDIELFDMDVERFFGNLRTPLRTSRGEVSRRESVIVRIHANIAGFNVSGRGEAAPLKGWGDDDLSQVRFELGRVRDMVFAGACPDPIDAMSRLRSPSARFALSSALLEAVAHARRKPLRYLFDSDAPHQIPVNAIIGLEPPERAAELALAAVASGFDTLKLKAGTDDLERVRAVRVAAPDVTLRLDANGAWDVEEAVERLAELTPFDLDYVEQPVRSIESLAALRGRVDVRIAADEDLLPIEAAHRIVGERIVDVVVLKPALLGGWAEILDLVRVAQEHEIDVVFTSALDSVIGRTVVAQVAAGILDGTTCGLGTAWFENDLGGGEDRVRDGRLYLGSGNGLGL